MQPFADSRINMIRLQTLTLHTSIVGGCIWFHKICLANKKQTNKKKTQTPKPIWMKTSNQIRRNICSNCCQKVAANRMNWQLLSSIRVMLFRWIIIIEPLFAATSCRLPELSMQKLMVLIKNLNLKVKPYNIAAIVWQWLQPVFI